MILLHRAERADRLVDALAGVVAEPLDDPLATELIAVHSRGIERWLAQELSLRLGAQAGRSDGVCANVAFPFPGRVVGRVLAAVGGVDPEADPWVPQRLVWPLLAEIDARLDEAWLAPLRVHLKGPAEQPDPTRLARRFGVARHLADLFDRYAVHRPDMLRAWAQQRDHDGAGEPLGTDAVWQARLWRHLRDRLGVPSPAERLVDVVGGLRAGVDLPDLPARLSLFGLTALPASYVTVLQALAATREVHLFLLHPSPALWQRVTTELEDRPASVPRRDADPTRALPRHPLLASWGRDARELQVVVRSAAGHRVHGAPDEHRELDGSAARTLLGRIQHDIRADRAPAGAPRPDHHDARMLLRGGDRSLQVHACHGRTRQVEVLRDAILHLLADDPSLEPRDIVVLCPDIETFAPIVHAVFGPHVTGDADEGADAGSGRLPDLRVRLADRAIRQTNPVLRVVAELLELADGRLGASQVCDLAAREPVRRRFRFDDDHLERLERWTVGAGIRWGLDAEHRAAFGLAGVAANTWRSGMDRLLLGVTMADSDDRLVGGAVPLDDVEGGDVDLAGRVAEFVDRLADAFDALRGPLPVTGWRTAIADAADDLTVTTERTRWQRLQLHRLLDDLVAEATIDGVPSGVELSLPEVRSLLESRLRGRPSRANHRTGDLTVCTLVPMRSVPHRVICLLGMDDGEFPRRTAADGDDLIDRDPHVGDRDPRTEDRQLLLDALLAATGHVVVTYTGRDERTNEPRPPAVPVGELLDVVDRTARTDDGSPARCHVTVDHPLQPFDPRNFAATGLGGLGGDRPWGFDPVLLRGARRLATGARTKPGFLDAPLPAPPDTGVVELDDLVAFLAHPVKAFLRRRLGVTLPRPTEGPPDAIPVELVALDHYAVGNDLLEARLTDGDGKGFDLERWVTAQRARGVLPPGGLAEKALGNVTQTVDALLAAATQHTDPAAARQPIDVDLALGGGERRLVGSVRDVIGDVVVSLQYARLAPKHRLAAWVRLLAAVAAQPARPLHAVTVGRYRRSGTKTVSVACLTPRGATEQLRREHALTALEQLVDLYDRGLRAPLPLYCKTSAAYAELAREDKDGTGAAQRVWVTSHEIPNEDRDPEHLLVLGSDTPFDDLLTQEPCPDEVGDGWVDGERHRFGRYARRLWDGLLSCEEVVDQ